MAPRWLAPEDSLVRRGPDAVLAALDGMTTVVSRGEEASQVADGAERADEAVSDDIRKVFERAERKRTLPRVASHTKRTPVKSAIEESPLSREVRQCLGFRFAWGHERIADSGGQDRRQPENIRAARASPA